MAPPMFALRTQPCSPFPPAFHFPYKKSIHSALSPSISSNRHLHPSFNFQFLPFASSISEQIQSSTSTLSASPHSPSPIMNSAFIPLVPRTCFLPSTALSTNVSSCRTTPKFTPIPRTRQKVQITSQKEFNYNIYQNDSDRAKRNVSSKDRAVIIQKPMGLVLEEGQDGMVFVAEMDPSGNAAESGDVKEGDILVAVSATFGEEVWSTRGVGLDRVMKSIRIRAGEFVTLVLESPEELSRFKDVAMGQAEGKRREARGDGTGVKDVVVKAEDTGAIYDSGEPEPIVIDDALKAKLKEEIAAPYKQNWILWVGAGILALVLLSVAFGSTT